jgi:hypothetical protein
MMMRKLAYTLAVAAFMGAATPASAQYLFVGGDGFGVGIGAGPYSWGGPAYSSYYAPAAYDAYAYDDGLGYSDWGASYAYAPAYRTVSYAPTYPSYRSASYNADAYAPSYPRYRTASYTPRSSSYRQAYAYAPECRIVNVRRQLADGTTVIRRTRSC